MSQNVQLIIIDPQRDFCDSNGALYVAGAEEDMNRLAVLVTRLQDKVSDIHITLDSHSMVDISHPIWWRNTAGAHADPFIQIIAADLRAVTWTTTQASAYERTHSYLNALATGGRYRHVVWPYHCLIGDEGHAVMPELSGMDKHTLDASRYGLSRARIDGLGASEYTLVGIVADASGSVGSFHAKIEQCVKEAVNSWRSSPRADNLMLRFSIFDNRVREVRGFKPLAACHLDQYTNSIRIGGTTAL